MKSTLASTTAGWGTICCALSLVLLAVAAAGWAQDNWQSPLIIPAAEFENNGVYPLEDKFYDVDGFFTGRGDRVLIMVAPAQLPPYVTITRFEAAVIDVDGCPSLSDVQVELRSVDFGTGTETVHATVFSADNGNIEIFADTTIASPLVNNLSHAYFVVVHMCGPFQAFQGVRVHYTE